MSFLIKKAVGIVKNPCRFCRTFSSTSDVAALAVAKERCPRCQANVQISHASAELEASRKKDSPLNTSINFNPNSLDELTRLSSTHHDIFAICSRQVQPESYSDVSSRDVTKKTGRLVPSTLRLPTDNTSNLPIEQETKINKSNNSTDEEHYYRRELPHTCISFASSEGKRIFAEALQLGFMEAFFSLAPQLTTQDEPAFCGLASLVVALNALQVDPGRVWKGKWRWYHETMLDCCVPLGRVVRNGITLREFASIAECNAVQARTRLADDSFTVNELRDVIRECTARSDRVLVCAYARKRVQQTGGGHFAPIGGYHPDRDMVLILDTARFKYPPHWLPVPLLLEAMRAPDPDAGGRPRGFCVLEKHANLPAGLRSVQLSGSLNHQAVEPKPRCHARKREVRKCSSCGFSDVD